MTDAHDVLALNESRASYSADLEPDELAFQDFDVTEPLLDDRAREFLSDYLERKEPGHAWRRRL